VAIIANRLESKRIARCRGWAILDPRVVLRSINHRKGRKHYRIDRKDYRIVRKHYRIELQHYRIELQCYRIDSKHYPIELQEDFEACQGCAATSSGRRRALAFAKGLTRGRTTGWTPPSRTSRQMAAMFRAALAF
jgi:hypothetical protein